MPSCSPGCGRAKVRLLSDENFHGDVYRGLRRLGVDIARVQDVGLRTRGDPTILQWAADNGRIVVSHDISTLPDHAYKRVGAGLGMPGVVVAIDDLPTGLVIDELAVIAGASDAEEWVNRVVYLPLR